MNDQFIFRMILKRSWDLMVSRPQMWLLAFFASAVAGVGVVDACLGAWRFMKTSAAPVIDFSSETGSVLWTWIAPPYNNLYLPLFGMLFIAIGVALFLASVISLGGLIRAAVDKKEHTIVSSWHCGVNHIWDMVGLVVMRRVVIAAIFLVAALLSSAMLRYSPAYGVIFSGFLIVVLVFLVLIVSFLSVYAQTAVVVEQAKFFESLGHAWQAFRGHALVSIEMAITLFVVELLFAVAAGVVFLLIAAPVFLLFVMSGVTGSNFFIMFGLMVGAVLITAIGFLFAAWSTQFTIASWSYLYLKLRKEKVPSRLVHFFLRK